MYNGNILIKNLDCVEFLNALPAASVDLILTDPPYNIGVKTKRAGKTIRNEWDIIPEYDDWFMRWVRAALHALKPNGVFYFWHNDFPFIGRIVNRIVSETSLVFNSFCVWNKGETYRARAWHLRDPDGDTPPRMWFNICEYCVEFFNSTPGKNLDVTAREICESDPAKFRRIKDWFTSEKERLGLTDKDLRESFQRIMNRKPFMLRHYFKDSQFQIPTREVYYDFFDKVGFRFPGGWDAMNRMCQDEVSEFIREHGEEGWRNYHRCDPMHSNVWNRPPIASANRIHTCQKPLDILERICRVSCRPGGTVCDCFMGSGSTGVAAIRAGLNFVGCERDPHFFKVAKNEIEKARRSLV